MGAPFNLATFPAVCILAWAGKPKRERAQDLGGARAAVTWPLQCDRHPPLPLGCTHWRRLRTGRRPERRCGIAASFASGKEGGSDDIDPWLSSDPAARLGGPRGGTPSEDRPLRPTLATRAGTAVRSWIVTGSAGGAGNRPLPGRRCPHPAQQLVRWGSGFRVPLVLGRDMGYSTYQSNNVASTATPPNG